jgi:hypothetical protein
MGDQQELFGAVAPVPIAWRALKEIAGGRDRVRPKVTAAAGAGLPKVMSDARQADISCAGGNIDV